MARLSVGTVVYIGMSILEAIILGLIQGLTEFIPISSSGHLVLAQYVLSGDAEHLFLQWINIGTVLALIIFFRQRIARIITEVLRTKDYRLARNIFIAMVPAGLIGFVFADTIESNPFFSSVWTVVVMLFAIGVVMIALERLPKLSPVADESSLPKKRAFIIGLAQAAALIPGTSRSGSTIIAGRFMGLNAARAAEFSFLVSIPIMLGVLLKVSVKASDRTYLMDNLTAIIVGNFFALISGLLAVGLLMRYLEHHSLSLFGWYRIILAIIIALVLILS